jgi:hypothetical protein
MSACASDGTADGALLYFGSRRAEVQIWGAISNE